MARLEVLEQEKEILEDEFLQSLALTEDLQVQLSQIKRAKCSRCEAELQR